MANITIEENVNKYLRDLFNEEQEVRINAINHLGDIGDELCLKELKYQLQYIDSEQKALLAAIKKLNQRMMNKE